MNILGLAAPFGHDAAAALIVDGQVVAAVEEERFTRKKHDGALPVNAINYCLKQAGLTPDDIDRVAFPWSINPLKKYRWSLFRRMILSKPSPAIKKLTRNKKEQHKKKEFVEKALLECGIDPQKVQIDWVEHQIAHCASSYYFSGMKESSVFSIDAAGEITSTWLGKAEDGEFTNYKEVLASDSLGAFYSTITDYLGFERGDGEYKVMGMASFGNSDKKNLDHILWWDKKAKQYFTNDEYVWVRSKKRFKKEKIYSKKMVEEFGPERQGDALSHGYADIAAAAQKKLEDITLNLVETYLKEDLEKHGNLCFAGGVALNVSLNRVLLNLPYVKRLYVQPSAHDAGTALGAAAFVAHQMGDQVRPMDHAYYGPDYTNEEILDELKKWDYKYSKVNDICETTSSLLDQGEVVAWFQGRMEWGPRALGARSILGNPKIKGTADRINEIIKFREQWRPFCPSILEDYSQEILGVDHPAPFMTIAFNVTDQWKDKIPEVVHVDGTMRPQIVNQKTNPTYYQLIKNFHAKSQVPVLINTSLNRRGEPMVCSPRDAMVMFEGSGLKYLSMGDYLVEKEND